MHTIRLINLKMCLSKRGQMKRVWTWHMRKINQQDSKYMYIHLPKIMLAILSFPHSNADDERIFSLVRKNASEFRPSLSTQTLSDLPRR